MSIGTVCAEVRNYFLRDPQQDIHTGSFTVSSAAPPDFLAEGQYFRIVGSVFNDGVYCNNEDGLKELKSESFTGAVWAMAVPPEFITLCKEIEAWCAANMGADSVNMSPFTSESFGGYSYTKGGKGSSQNGSGSAAVTWQDQFAARLNPYRKVRVL